jgi:hypothetical protein
MEENTGSSGFRTTYSIDDLGDPLDQLAYQLLDQAETEFVRCIIRNGNHVASVSDSYQNYIDRGEESLALARNIQRTLVPEIIPFAEQLTMLDICFLSQQIYRCSIDPEDMKGVKYQLILLDYFITISILRYNARTGLNFPFPILHKKRD